MSLATTLALVLPAVIVGVGMVWAYVYGARQRRRLRSREAPATLEGGGSHLSAAPARGVPAPLGRRRLG